MLKARSRARFLMGKFVSARARLDVSETGSRNSSQNSEYVQGVETLVLGGGGVYFIHTTPPPFK